MAGNAAEVTLNYAALASQCATVNEFNRLHIDLERVLSPLELCEIAALPDLAQPSREWLQKLATWCPDMFKAPRPFQRQSLSDKLTSYTDGRPLPAAPNLLLAFAGNAQLLMMPVAMFLQFIDPAKWDVAVFRKPRRPSIFGGIDGLARDFPGIVRYLAEATRSSEYRRVITIGTSGGGFAALWGAILLGADRGISVGGALPKNPNISLPAPQDKTDLRLVFSAALPREEAAAKEIANVLGGTLHPVANIEKHNVLHPLIKRGEFTEFMARMLA